MSFDPPLDDSTRDPIFLGATIVPASGSRVIWSVRDAPRTTRFAAAALRSIAAAGRSLRGGGEPARDDEGEWGP